MKLIVWFVYLYICYTNVSGSLLKFGAAIASKTLKCHLLRNANLDVSKIHVYFYDFQNHVYRNYPIDKAAHGILSIKILVKTKNFLIYVGGFKSNIKKDSAKLIRDAFKNIPNSYLIMVDHSAYTHDEDGYKTSYDRSVKYVPSIGKKLAEMLADLRKGGVSPKTMRCIGHSLGGQILGYVGENFKKETGQTISRITALDPAGPCFASKSTNDHIRSGVADYVEIYHCNAGVLGSHKSVGDVNFFANNGKYQPQCGKTSVLSISKSLASVKCSHKLCVLMWTASILHRYSFPAYKCNKFKDIEQGNFDHCSKTTAGFWNPGTATGNYYFLTNGTDLN